MTTTTALIALSIIRIVIVITQKAFNGFDFYALEACYLIMSVNISVDITLFRSNPAGAAF